jgi:hypothetical protein
MAGPPISVELIARVFAETGIKDLFRKVLELVCKRQSAPRILRLRNRWVTMDPRQWDSGMDMSSASGSAPAAKLSLLTHLQTLQQKAAHDAAKLALERRKVEADIAFDLARLEADIALKREAMAAKAGTSCAACAAKKETAA